VANKKREIILKGRKLAKIEFAFQNLPTEKNSFWLQEIAKFL
jgi:hypothetical protein